MPMPLDEKKRGSIIKLMATKLKSGEDYDEMKRYNSEDAFKQEDEEMEKSAQCAAAEGIIRAFETRNAEDLMKALKGFLELQKN